MNRVTLLHWSAITSLIALILLTLAWELWLAPLREGGSLPGIVEADDLGTYVCKFRGAGQGARRAIQGQRAVGFHGLAVVQDDVHM